MKSDQRSTDANVNIVGLNLEVFFFLLLGKILMTKIHGIYYTFFALWSIGDKDLIVGKSEETSD